MSRVIEVPVSGREWRYLAPLSVIAEFMREKWGEAGRSERVSRYRITKVLRPLEDYAMGRLDKAATISMMMDILERDYGIDSEEEKTRLVDAVRTLVEEVDRVRRFDKDRVFDFINGLRYALIGIFKGYYKPVPPGGGKE